MNFDEYVAARGPGLLRLAFVLTADSHLAQDLVQIGLARAYSKWAWVSAAEHPDAYVRRILVNEHIGARRRRWWGERPGRNAGDVNDAATATATRDVADEVAERDQARRVLDSLPTRARTVLVLRYYADLDDIAIADLMGLSPSSVRSTASRALATLRVDLVPPTTTTTGELR